MIAPSRTITAPIGTSFLFIASRARSNALRMYCSSAAGAPAAPNAATFGSLSTGKCGLSRPSESELALGIAIDDDVIAFAELALEHCQRQWILQQTLDSTLERAGAKCWIVAFDRENFSRRRRQLECELPIAEQALESLELKVDDVLDLLPAERTEDDDVINAIEELGTEVLTQRVRDLRFDDRLILPGVLEDIAAADIRRHDDD